MDNSSATRAISHKRSSLRSRLFSKSQRSPHEAYPRRSRRAKHHPGEEKAQVQVLPSILKAVRTEQRFSVCLKNRRAPLRPDIAANLAPCACLGMHIRHRPMRQTMTAQPCIKREKDAWSRIYATILAPARFRQSRIESRPALAGWPMVTRLWPSTVPVANARSTSATW